jgi:hypothetical protein
MKGGGRYYNTTSIAKLKVFIIVTKLNYVKLRKLQKPTTIAARVTKNHHLSYF